MNDLNKKSLKSSTKIGSVVTLFVLTACITACSSEVIPNDGALIPASINSPTPEPSNDSPASALASTESTSGDKAPTKSFRQSRLGRRHAIRTKIAGLNRRHKGHHSLKSKQEQSVAIASVESKPQINGPSSMNPMDTIQAPTLTTENSNFDANDHATRSWALWFVSAMLVASGLLWVALRKSPQGRMFARKARGIVYNS